MRDQALGAMVLTLMSYFGHFKFQGVHDTHQPKFGRTIIGLSEVTIKAGYGGRKKQFAHNYLPS